MLGKRPCSVGIRGVLWHCDTSPSPLFQYLFSELFLCFLQCKICLHHRWFISGLAGPAGCCFWLTLQMDNRKKNWLKSNKIGNCDQLNRLSFSGHCRDSSGKWLWLSCPLSVSYVAACLWYSSCLSTSESFTDVLELYTSGGHQHGGGKTHSNCPLKYGNILEAQPFSYAAPALAMRRRILFLHCNP